MKDIPAIKGRHYIASLIAEGEHEHQDFKFQISDARKIARSISAFANNDGGRLLIGVKDNGNVAGIRNEEDIYVVESAASIYCRPAIEVKFTAFKVDPGVIVIRAEIPRAERRPINVVEDGGELRAYFRVNDENIVAPEMLTQAWEMKHDGADSLIDIDDRHRLLIDLINRNGGVELSRFVTESHLPTSAATRMVARLIAAEAVAATWCNHAWLITLPQ